MSELLKTSKTFGASSVRLPPLGFGAAAIGNLYRAVSDKAAKDAVQAAIDAGVRYFDTAPHYGFGLSERRLGEALAHSLGQDWRVISTKVGRRLEPYAGADATAERHGFVNADPYEPVFDYSYDGVMRSFDSSLKRLSVDRIDILLAHDLGRLTHGNDHPFHFAAFLDGGYRAMRTLRDSGAVGAIGLGVNEWQICEEAMAHADFDGFLLAGRYTLLEQTALDTFLPLCRARNASIILGGPFNSGILAHGVHGDTIPHYNYAPAPSEVIETVSRIERICTEHNVPLAAAALQFPFAHPDVACVIPGMNSPRQVDAAMRLIKIVIPPELWDDLRAAGLLHRDAPTPVGNQAA